MTHPYCCLRNASEAAGEALGDVQSVARVAAAAVVDVAVVAAVVAVAVAVGDAAAAAVAVVVVADVESLHVPIDVPIANVAPSFHSDCYSSFGDSDYSRSLVKLSAPIVRKAH
jgi:hypothetical protein